MGSFEQLFRQQYTFVCQTVYRYIRDKSKVEDIAQEIFAELWMKKDVIHIHTSIQSYLRRMAVTRALNYIRDTRKYNWDELDITVESVQESIIQDPTAIHQLEESDLRNKIDHVIQQLPEKCRIVFLLSRNDELSYSEISRQLNISIKTVENQIGKALKLLRIALTDDRG
ncbi:MAG TPA: RNA polymerase sigma-70 factor [Saprospiraceae bacterium]|nr:RNA polymerase sigma-70 factor [Saprospiraceae bacterium]